MKLLVGFFLWCLFVLGQTKFIDLFSYNKRLNYRLMDKICNPLTKRCVSGVNEYKDYAVRCIYEGCRPATINSQYDIYTAKIAIDRRYEDGAMYIGLSNNNSDGQMRWANGRAATSSTDKNIIPSQVMCPTCKRCLALHYDGQVRRKRCTSQYSLIRGICECRSRTIQLELQIENVIVFNKNDDVMGGFRVLSSSPLSFRGTIATKNKVGKFQIIIYLNLKNNTYTSDECKRAEGEKQDKFQFEETVKIGDYNYGGGSTTTTKKEVARVHADLGQFEFPSKSSSSGSIISIEKSGIPALIPKVSYKYFVVIWQNNRSIGCAGIRSYRLYGFWEEYNKAMFRYATGINIGTRDP